MEKIKTKLYKDMDSDLSAIQQILLNRGIPLDKQNTWLNANEEQLIPWKELDPHQMEEAVRSLHKYIKQDEDILVNVDCDMDGYSSAAILINFLYEIEPEWTKDHVYWIHHKGKQHGLSDIMDEIADTPLTYAAIFCPDSSSNDYDCHVVLEHAGTHVICLDHHICEQETYLRSPATIINVQTCNYPNKSLTGAGVTYKFIEAYTEIYELDKDIPKKFIDLCAMGNCGDMADYRVLEIRALMNLGLNNDKLTNPFIRTMRKKNDYSISQMNGLNYYSAAFYIVPFVNAIVRSGTMEEKELIFKSMLTLHAFEKIDSSKRGHKGEQVLLYEEAVVIAERVKRRQTKLQDESMALLEEKIQKKHLLDNAIILLLCEPGQVEKSIAGLTANKIQAKYQRPAAVLTYSKTKNDREPFYRGSMRNYGLSPVKDLKSELERTGQMEYVQGHNNAAGCGIAASKIDDFLKAFNEQYKDIDQTPLYWIDYEWTVNTLEPKKILDIGYFNIYGQEIPESLVCVKDICLRPNMITLMSPDKHPTLKISLGNVEMIKFGSSQEEYEEFCEDNMVLTCICKCKVNEWNGKVSPQLIIEQFELREEWIF